MNTEPIKEQTVLPYVLGGKDDPHFQEDIGGNWTPDRIEANEDRYKEECPNCGNPLIDCNGNCIFDDWPNRGWSLRDEGRSFGEGESYGERNA